MNRGTKTLLNLLKNAELKGVSAHKTYAPPQRNFLSQEEISAKNPKFAAVNILLFQKNENWFFPMIVRSNNENDLHSGQISLPGGKWEIQDRNFAETAVRETGEELGIKTADIQIIKKLSPIYIQPSNFLVYPFVSYIIDIQEFKIQKMEVSELLEFPLENIKNLSETPEISQLNDLEIFRVPVIRFKNYEIWGAIAMILNELHYMIK